MLRLLFHQWSLPYRFLHDLISANGQEVADAQFAAMQDVLLSGISKTDPRL